MITVDEYIHKAKVLDNIDIVHMLDRRHLMLSPYELLPNYPNIPYKEQYPGIHENEIFEKYILPKVVTPILIPPRIPRHLIDGMLDLIQHPITGTA